MADIYINYGKDLAQMTFDLMAAADIASRLNSSTRVCLKPNLVMPRPAEEGATTHPEIAAGVLRYLRECGVRDVTIAESAWVGADTAHAWRACGYTALAREYGAALVDTKHDPTIRLRFGDLWLDVCKTLLESDCLINLPVLKAHCQTGMTCCLKNLKGCIPDSEKRRYHSLGLDEPIAALNAVLKPQLHIIDGICGDLTFEEGGNPVDSGLIMLGFDPVLLDSYCAGMIGFEPDEIGHLRLAERYGAGQYFGPLSEITALNTQNRPKTAPSRSRTVQRLASFIEEKSACSACYAALIRALHKTRARPPKEKIKIGQGFKGKHHSGPGVGDCACGCDAFVGGCPPSALEIAKFLDAL